MRNILKYIVLILAVTVLASCANHYTMRGDTFTVVRESRYHVDSLSKYILEYKDNSISIMCTPISELEVICHKDAFDVGDKVKLIKIEE